MLDDENWENNDYSDENQSDNDDDINEVSEVANESDNDYQDGYNGYEGNNEYTLDDESQDDTDSQDDADDQNDADDTYNTTPPTAEEKPKSTISADLIRGHINTIILRTLSERDKYGYEIIDEIEKKSHGQYEMKQPTLYSALKRLENQGYIKAYWKTDEISAGGRRKYFTLTESGKEITERNRAEWEYSRTVIDNLISDQEYDFSKPAPNPVDFKILKQSTSRVPTVRLEEHTKYEGSDAVQNAVQTETDMNEQTVIEYSYSDNSKTAVNIDMNDYLFTKEERAIIDKIESVDKNLPSGNNRYEPEQTVSNVTENNTEQYINQPPEQLTKQPVEQATQQTEQAYEQQVEQPYEQQAEQTYEQQAEQTYEQQTEQTYEQQAEQTYEQQAEQTYEQQAEQHYDQPTVQQSAQSSATYSETYNEPAEQYSPTQDAQPSEQHEQQHEQYQDQIQEQINEPVYEPQQENGQAYQQQQNTQNPDPYYQEYYPETQEQAPVYQQQADEEQYQPSEVSEQSASFFRSETHATPDPAQPYDEPEQQYNTPEQYDSLDNQDEDEPYYYSQPDEAQPEYYSRDSEQYNRLHENYLKLLDENYFGKDGRKPEPEYGENLDTDKLIYNNKPETERDYKNLINDMYSQTLKSQYAPPPMPPEQPQYAQPEPQPMPEREYMNNNVYMPRISHNEEARRAESDGLKIYTSDQQPKPNGKYTKNYNLGETLFKSSIITFVYMIIIFTVTLIFKSTLDVGYIYPFLIFAVACAVIMVCAVMALCGFGKNSVKPVTHGYIAISIVLTVIAILIVCVVAVLLNVDFESVSDVCRKMLIPSITLLAAPLFTIAFYLFSK